MCVEELVVVSQGCNLWAFITFVEGHNVGYVKYAEGVCTKNGYNFVTEAPEAEPKLKGGEGSLSVDKEWYFTGA